MPTFFERREVVTPGDLLAEGDYLTGDNTYRENSKIYSTCLGLVEYEDKKINVVALKAFYTPKVGDIVIGKTTEVTIGGWIVDISAPYTALLRAQDVLERSFKPSKDDLTSIFDVGDLIIAKIVAYDRARDPLLTVSEPGLGKITHGQTIEITPTKIPRVIGRKGSMISMIKRETGCHIVLGQNGIILVNGKTPESEQSAVMAIRKIEEESHTSGLTDRIKEMFGKEKKEVSKNVSENSG